MKTLRDATSEQVENFVTQLAEWAEKDRNGLLCQLNSYMPFQKRVGGRDGHYWAPTGSPEAVARPRFPQNVACRFPALRSSEDDSQHCESL